LQFKYRCEAGLSACPCGQFLTCCSSLALYTKDAAVNIDERLEKMAERHEALAQSVDLLLIATRENTENIGKLVEVTNQDAESIRALARIAELHDRRITNIEGGTSQ
jgi:hypothetical protein